MGRTNFQKIAIEYSQIAKFMGPTWGRQDTGGPHIGPMNLAIWVAYIVDYPLFHWWLSGCLLPGAPFTTMD